MLRPRATYLYLMMIIFLVMVHVVRAQPFSLPDGQSRQKITFQLVHNLVIIPVSINGEGPFHFILDSGVGPLIITDTTMVDSLYASNLSLFKMRGRGIGSEIEAYVVNNMYPSIGAAKTNGLSLILLKNDPFQLSSYVGMPIHGIIGSDVFESFSVKINYQRQQITLYRPDASVRKRGERIPLEIIKNKPYLEVALTNDTTTKHMLLLLDSGAGHAVSLENQENTQDLVPERTIEANLGIGLNGAIHGQIGRLKEIGVGDYKLKDVIVAYPSSENADLKLLLGDRNGSIGGELLKRFHVFIDYANSEIFLKKNNKFYLPFEHNMSGMEIYVVGNNNNRQFFISRIEVDSPAAQAGLKVNDQILSINLKEMSAYSLEGINELMHKRTTNQIVIQVLRKGDTFFKVLILERRI